MLRNILPTSPLICSILLYSSTTLFKDLASLKPRFLDLLYGDIIPTTQIKFTLTQKTNFYKVKEPYLYSLEVEDQALDSWFKWSFFYWTSWACSSHLEGLKSPTSSLIRIVGLAHLFAKSNITTCISTLTNYTKVNTTQNANLYDMQMPTYYIQNYD